MLEINNILPGVKENISLAEFTTYKIGGAARYFYVAKNEDDLAAAASWAQEQKIPWIVLGGGTNLLISDDGFDGLVIKNENFSFEVSGTKITVGSGLSLAYLVMQSAEHSLSGLEFFAGIPGTVGGAIYGNAGAWGHGIGETVESIKVWHNGKILNLPAAVCEFSYRHSLMRQKKYLILSAVLVLPKSIKEEVNAKIGDYLRQRSGGSQPKEASAGCTFRNIDASKVDVARVKRELEISDEEYATVTKFGKLPVGFVLEHLGFQGKKIGGAEISTVHCNFIVNSNAAKATDVIQLINFIKQQTRDRLGVQLEEEVQYLGFE